MVQDDLGLEPFDSDPQLAEFPKERIDKALAGAKRMSEKYVEKGPYEFFSDAVTVELVQRGLAKMELLQGKRYCP
jgi:ferredoxin thioredoxin reductase catalytic beta subunit